MHSHFSFNIILLTRKPTQPNPRYRRSGRSDELSIMLCVLSSHLFWTSGLCTYQPGSHRKKVTNDFSILLLRCTPYFFSREGLSHPFPSSTAKANFVCVCVFSSHPFWTSSSLDVPAGVTQEEGHTGFLIHLPSAVRALIFVARRIQPFLSLVDREVEFCVLTN